VPKSRFDVRPALVIVKDGRLLLLRQTTWSGENLWVLPGGRLEPGESLTECACRELAEETGLEARAGRLLYVGDFIIQGKHNVDMAFLGEGVSGTLVPRPGEIADARFVPLDELSALQAEPAAMIRRIVEDAPDDFPPGPVYLGRYG